VVSAADRAKLAQLVSQTLMMEEVRGFERAWASSTCCE
jgi:hypothetical protein